MSPPPRLSRRFTPLAVYLVVALGLTWPLVLVLSTRLAALQGPGDPFLNLWILGWDLQSLAERPWSVVDGRVFDATIFHPARQTLAYSDHLLLQAIAVWPVYALTRNVVVCYNVLFLGSLVGAALAMHVWARAVTGSQEAAYVAGTIWGFWPYHFSHLPHLQLQGLYFLPLACLFLHRLVAGARRRDAALLGFMAALQAVSSVYYGVIGTLGLAVAAIALVVAVGGRGKLRLARRFLLASAVGAIVVAPVVWPYWQVQRREGFGRTLAEAGRHAAGFGSYVSVPPTNLFYGRTGLLRSEEPERGLFLGLTAIGLAATGFWYARRHGRWPVAVAMGVVAVTGMVLSLGPDGWGALYAVAHRFVYGFEAIRAPARFAVLVGFGVAGLAALGVNDILRRVADAGGRRGLAASVITALVVAEYANAPLPYAAAPPRRTGVGQWLRNIPGPGAVLHVPLTIDVENTPPMVQSLEHGRPVVNGYSGHRPGFFTSLADAMTPFPSAEALWTLRELEARFVVSPAPLKRGDWPLVERARFLDEPPWGGVIYEVRWTPDIEERLARALPPPPPPSGPAPFTVGEVAVYRVYWTGVGHGLAAGTASLRVLAPPSGPVTPAEAVPPAYRFVLEATTADWMARFFQARDRFETVADRQIRPLLHERHLREGRRVVDRVVTYDHGRLLVHLQDGEPSSHLSLRIAPGARDPLTAFYYARSFDLNAVRELKLPLNDLGRNYVLDLGVGSVGDVEYQARRVRALRIEPRVVQRIARRQAVAITAWVSLDARRIPLVVEVAAGFGSVRAELVEHTPGF